MKNWRINLIFSLFLLVAAAIISRLICIQIMKGDFYRALSQSLHANFEEGTAERGEIFLADGKSIAINIDWPLVFAQPKEINNYQEVAESLTSILKIDQDILMEKITQNNSYSVLKRKLNPEEIEKIEELRLDGIYVRKEKGRYYPQEELASQAVGFMGAEQKGQYGLEEFYNTVLEGEEGLLEQKKGNSLILTIDYEVQFKTEQLLKKAREELNIEGGQIIVAEPATGAILAMADLFNFNPNQYEDYAEQGQMDVFKNRATQELFEPGSVFKPITMAAALEEGRITPDTTYIDEGAINIAGFTIYNYDQRVYQGPQTMTNVLEKSINTGAVFAQREVGPNAFLKYVERFGFFEPTGIDMQETYSVNRELKKGREINFATASFGQGIEMTPTQLIRAYLAIANGGTLVRPHLVSQVINKDNEPVRNEMSDKAQEEKEIISSKTASQLAAMLVSVVENGFSKGAKVPGYFVAGKTGTAQVSYGALGIDKKGYSEKTIQTFVGFAPAFNPKFLVLVKLNNPDTRTAEYSAVPIFRELAEFIIHLYQIPPDYEE